MTSGPEDNSPAKEDRGVGYVLGIDIGGTGSRVAVAPRDTGRTAGSTGAERYELHGPGVLVSSSGSSVPQLGIDLVERAVTAWPELRGSVVGVGVGATGVASLVPDPTGLAARLQEEVDAPGAVAADAVTAHLGALGGDGGAVVVLGTGAIAIGHSGPDSSGVFAPNWRRVDGWGHLLGDRGGGAWVGKNALALAMRAHDGVAPAEGFTSGDKLLEAAVQRFGDPTTWPGQLYNRDDRAGILAGFARDVVDLAEESDADSVVLLTRAGQEAAHSVVGALETNDPQQVVLTGGLARAGGSLRDGFLTGVAEENAAVTVREAEGDPLDGALTLARLAAEGRLQSQEGLLWICGDHH